MRLNSHALTFFLMAAWLASPALADPGLRDQEPLPVTEAFQYVVADTGQAFEIDWAIADGYYLYKKKLGFESADDKLKLGAPELPDGLDYEDEFFGPQQIYRERFFVTIPYTVSGERPASAELLIKSQGCADLGLCYPPQRWTVSVDMKSVDVKSIASGGANLALDKALSTLGGSSEFPPVDDVFIPEVFPLDGNTVEVGFRIEPGF
ncbi:MAG: protein-disulfide reductase DsbD domain-containing protein [Woeseiaceae bacterium]